MIVNELMAGALSPNLVKVDFAVIAKKVLEEHEVLAEKISMNHGVPEQDVETLLAEVFKYLFLVAKTEKRLTPSHLIDMAWHEFILCTRLYIGFCEKHFGRYIHHFPGKKGESHHVQFKMTIKYYFIVFGTPPEKYWGHFAHEYTQDASCGSCES